MGDWKKLSDREILDAMRADTPVNRVRQIFSNEVATFEQALQQRVVPTPIEYRRMEFEAAEKLISASGNDALVKALENASIQCGNVIFNCEQRPAGNEKHLRSWRAVKEYIDGAIVAREALAKVSQS